MEKLSGKLLSAGKWLFLFGVAFLVIRKNEYPWPVKRASDVLFLSSAIAVAAYFTAERSRHTLYSVFRPVRTALALVFAGLLIATTSGYLIGGRPLDADGMLSLGRFAEVAVIVLLAGIFSRADRTFPRKAAFLQLLTLAYLGALFAPELAKEMPRFELFENWPSNAGYYLIASISLLAVLLLKYLVPFRKRFFLAAVGSAGLFSILLWTQSRAAWLGTFIALTTILFVWARGMRAYRAGAFLGGAAIFVLIATLGFSLLAPNIKNLVVTRLTPGLYVPSLFHEERDPSETTNLVIREIGKGARSDFLALFGEPSRPALWRAYTEKLAQRPLGLGVNYEAVSQDGYPRGPHNTILELLVLGGPLTLAGAGILFFSGAKNLVQRVQERSDSEIPLFLAAALAGLLTASFFDNMSTFRLMWALAGLAVYLPPANYYERMP